MLVVFVMIRLCDVYFTLAAITAAAAAFTQVVGAGVFCAVDTDIAGDFATDGAGKR